MRFKKADAKTLGEPPQFCQYDETAKGYHLWQSQDDNRTALTEITNKNILQIRRCEWEIFHIQLM